MHKRQLIRIRHNTICGPFVCCQCCWLWCWMLDWIRGVWTETVKNIGWSMISTWIYCRMNVLLELALNNELKEQSLRFQTVHSLGVGGEWMKEEEDGEEVENSHVALFPGYDCSCLQQHFDTAFWNSEFMSFGLMSNFWTQIHTLSNQ